MAVGTGTREGELLALELADFDLPDGGTGTVRVNKMLDQRDRAFVLQPPKSKTGFRTVGLPVFAVDAIRAHIAGRAPGPVFTTKNGSYFARSNFIRQDWTDLLGRAGVKYRRFHTLRHTMRRGYWPTG